MDTNQASKQGNDPSPLGFLMNVGCFVVQAGASYARSPHREMYECVQSFNEDQASWWRVEPVRGFGIFGEDYLWSQWMSGQKDAEFHI